MEEEVKLVGRFYLSRKIKTGPWDVYPSGINGLCGTGHLCRVEIMPGRGRTVEDEYDFANPHKAYRVTAVNFPNVGNLNQIVRGEDLVAYLESVAYARGFGIENYRTITV